MKSYSKVSLEVNTAYVLMGLSTTKDVSTSISVEQYIYQWNKGASIMARALLGNIHIHGVDHERIGKNDEIETDRAIDVELDLSQPTANIDINPVKWGGECRVEIQVKARLLVNEQILVEGNVKLFEGGSEDTDDLEDEQPFEFFVPKRTRNLPPTEHEMKVISTGSGGGDYAEIKFSLTNRVGEYE